MCDFCPVLGSPFKKVRKLGESPAESHKDDGGPGVSSL